MRVGTRRVGMPLDGQRAVADWNCCASMMSRGPEEALTSVWTTAFFGTQGYQLEILDFPASRPRFYLLSQFWFELDVIIDNRPEPSGTLNSSPIFLFHSFPSGPLQNFFTS